MRKCINASASDGASIGRIVGVDWVYHKDRASLAIRLPASLGLGCNTMALNLRGISGHSLIRRHKENPYEYVTDEDDLKAHHIYNEHFISKAREI